MPIYSSETKWYVNEQGLLSVEVGGVIYGEGSKVEEGEEIPSSENPMLQSWWNDYTTDFHAEEYRTKITKAKFAINVKVPNSKIKSWDVSEAKDGSVMAWIEDDGSEGYILTIAGKEKIIANNLFGNLFRDFINLKEIENIEFLDVSNTIHMSALFYYYSSLASLDLSKWDTNKVSMMPSMFHGCISLESINFGENFDISKLTLMDKMFYRCFNLTTTLKIQNNTYLNNNVKAGDMFNNAAVYEPAQITLNYTTESESIVDSIIAGKGTSNIVKGVQI